MIIITPEVQAVLSRKAAAQGIDIRAYAASLLDDGAGADRIEDA